MWRLERLAPARKRVSLERHLTLEGLEDRRLLDCMPLLPLSSQLEDSDVTYISESVRETAPGEVNSYCATLEPDDTLLIALIARVGATPITRAEQIRSSLIGPEGPVELDWNQLGETWLTFYRQDDSAIAAASFQIQISSDDVQNTWSSVLAIRGVEFEQISAIAPHLLTAPENSETTWVKSILPVLGDSSQTTTLVEEFDQPQLDDRWSLLDVGDRVEYVLGPDSFEPSFVDASDGALRLVVHPSDEEAAAVRRAVLFEYSSATGELSIRSSPGSPIVAIEILSRSSLFNGHRPSAFDGVFDVFLADKMFKLDLQGTHELQLGNVLPPGMTQDELSAEISVTGAFAFGGAIESALYSVDGAITLEEAMAEHWPQQGYRPLDAKATIRLESTPGSWGMLTVDHQVGPTDPEVGNSENVRRDFSVWVSTDKGVTWQFKTLIRSSAPACPGCMRRDVIAVHNLTSETWIRFRNRSGDSTWLIDRLEWNSYPAEFFVNRYEVDLQPESQVTIRPEFLVLDSLDWSASIFDADGSLVTAFQPRSRSITLSSDSLEPGRYTLEIQPRWPAYPALLTGNILSSLPLAVARPYVVMISQEPNVDIGAYSVRIVPTDEGLDISFPDPVDWRHCSLESFSWDGPELFAMDWWWDTQLSISVDGGLSPGIYHLSINDGECLPVSGRYRAESTIDIDFVAPELVELSLAEEPWLREESPNALVLKYSEPVAWIDYSWQIVINGADHSYTVESDGVIGGDDRIHSFDDTVFVQLPPLLAGDYTIDIGSFGIYDEAGNPSTSPIQVVAFTVSDIPPEKTNNRFDVNRDGAIDLTDLSILSDLLITNWPTRNLDMDQNGIVTPADYDFLARHGLGLQPGDVDLDGDFDQDDLEQMGGSSRFDWHASWTEGDFDGDGRFTSRDLVLAMTEGWYELDDESRQRKQSSNRQRS